MGLYPPLETEALESGANYRLQHIAELRYRLEKERDFRARLHKKYRRAVNIVDGIDTTLSLVGVGLSATGIGLLSTIIAAPIAIGLQAGAIACGLVGTGGRAIGRKLQTKAKKHDQICVLAESKLNTIADHISKALNDDKITDEEFHLILSEVDKYNEMKSEIRTAKLRQGVGLSEVEKKKLTDEAIMSARAKLLQELRGSSGT